jgi:hypothetical protein
LALYQVSLNMFHILCLLYVQPAHGVTWCIFSMSRVLQCYNFLVHSQWKVAEICVLASPCLSIQCRNSGNKEHIFMKFYSEEFYYNFPTHAHFC